MTWELGLDAGPLDPDETVPYDFDFTEFLAEGEAVASANVTSNDLTVDNVDQTGNIVTAHLTGGTVGERAEVEFTCTGDAAPPTIIERSVFFWIASL